MGLRFRKRTKGSKSWMNISKSGFTHSYRITDKLTVNIGKDGVRRSTLNIGNGLSFVKNLSAKRKVETTASPGIFDNPAVLMWIIGISVVVMIIDLIFL